MPPVSNTIQILVQTNSYAQSYRQMNHYTNVIQTNSYAQSHRQMNHYTNVIQTVL